MHQKGRHLRQRKTRQELAKLEFERTCRAEKDPSPNGTFLLHVEQPSTNFLTTNTFK